MWPMIFQRARVVYGSCWWRYFGVTPNQKWGCSSRDVTKFRDHWIWALALHNVPEPKWSVKWIVEHVLKSEQDETEPRVFSKQQFTMADQLLRQRLERIPVQYIIGEWEFRNLTLTMRPPVFIPGPWTEMTMIGAFCQNVGKLFSELKDPARLQTHCTSFPDLKSLYGRFEDLGMNRDQEPGHKVRRYKKPLVQRGKQLVGLVIHHCCHSNKERPQRFLDVGSGSGAIAISLLQECQPLKGYAVDISEDAVNLTTENAARNGVSDRLSVLHCPAEHCSRLFSANQLDFIVSNPPYIVSKDVPTLQPEVAWYVDHLALDGGTEGLNQAATILDASRHILKKNGQVWLEMGLGQTDGIQRMICLHREWEMEYESTYKDFTGRERFHLLVRR